MKRFLAMLATGALALGLSSGVHAQTRGFAAGAFILDDLQAPAHKVVLTAPVAATPAWTAWQTAGFPTLTWSVPIPPVSGAQAGFMYTGPLTAAPAFPGTAHRMPYWLYPNEVSSVPGDHTANGGPAGTWDYATSAELGLVSAASGTLNFMTKFTPNGTTLGNSALFENGTNLTVNTAAGVNNPMFSVTLANGNTDAEGTGTFGALNMVVLGTAAATSEIQAADGTINTPSSLNVNAGKLTVDAATGNTVTLGTLDVTGNTRLRAKNGVAPASATLNLSPTTMGLGDYANIVFADPDGGTTPMEMRYFDNSDPSIRFIGGSLQAGTTGAINYRLTTATGNTTSQGNLDYESTGTFGALNMVVLGTAAATSEIQAGDGTINTPSSLNVNAGKFTVDQATGNTVVAGTLDAQTSIFNSTGLNGGAVGINDNLVPTTDLTRDLGSATLRWNNAFIGPVSLHLVSKVAGPEVGYLDRNFGLGVTTTGNFTIGEAVGGADRLTLTPAGALTTAAGMNATSGNINAAAGTLQTNGVTRIANNGDATLGTITGGSSLTLGTNAPVQGSLVLNDNAATAFSGTIQTVGTLSAPRTYTLPDASGTLSLGGITNGTTNNSTLSWNGTNWAENVNLLSDATNGNTQVNGTLDARGAISNGTGAVTISDALNVNANDGSANLVNINTGTSTGAVAIGGAGGTVDLQTTGQINIGRSAGALTNIGNGLTSGQIDIEAGTATQAIINNGANSGKTYIGRPGAAGSGSVFIGAADGNTVEINNSAGTAATSIGQGGNTGSVSIGNTTGNTSITGDIAPSVDNTYKNGTAALRWSEVNVGPGSFHTRGTAAEIGGTARDYSIGIGATGNFRIREAATDLVTVSPLGALTAIATSGATAVTGTTSGIGASFAANNSVGVGFTQGAVVTATNTGTGSSRGITISATGQTVGAGGVDGAIIGATITGGLNSRGVVSSANATNGSATGGAFTAANTGAGTSTGITASASGSTANNIGASITSSGAGSVGVVITSAATDIKGTGNTWNVTNAGALTAASLTATTAAGGVVIGTGVNATTLTSTASAARAISFPDVSGTLLVGGATGTGVDLQSATPGTQQTGHINVSGTIIGGTGSFGALSSSGNSTIGTGANLANTFGNGGGTTYNEFGTGTNVANAVINAFGDAGTNNNQSPSGTMTNYFGINAYASGTAVTNNFGIQNGTNNAAASVTNNIGNNVAAAGAGAVTNTMGQAVAGLTASTNIGGGAGTSSVAIATGAAAGTIGLTGATNINITGAATTSIGTGATGAVNIGNTTGGTAVTGPMSVSGVLTASTGTSGLVLGTGVNATTLTSTASAARAISFPDAAGTLALTSDLSSYLPLAGGTMSGAINMGGQNITNGGTAAFTDLTATGAIALNNGAGALTTNINAGTSTGAVAIGNNATTTNTLLGAQVNVGTGTGNTGIGNTTGNVTFNANATVTETTGSHVFAYGTVAAGATITVPAATSVVEITDDAAVLANAITLPAGVNGQVLIIHNGDAQATSGGVAIPNGATWTLVKTASGWQHAN